MVRFAIFPMDARSLLRGAPSKARVLCGRMVLQLPPPRPASLPPQETRRWLSRVSGIARPLRERLEASLTEYSAILLLWHTGALAQIAVAIHERRRMNRIRERAQRGECQD